MPARHALGPLVIALAAGLAAPGPAAAEEASFGFSIAGLPVGSMTLAAKQTGSRYDATARLDTTGLVGMLAEFFFNGQANGILEPDGTVVPDLFTATSRSPRALRHTSIAWQGGTPVKVSVDPPRASAPDPADQGGALDPVSAGFRLFRDAPPDAICNTTVYVFDGSRRSRLVLAPPARDGRQLTCAGKFARVEGEAASLADLREFPFSVTFRTNDAGVAQLARIEAPTNFGRAVISRTD